MKTVCKKLLCLMLVAMLLVSAVPAAFAAETESVIKLFVSGKYVTEMANPMDEATTEAVFKHGDAEESIKNMAMAQWPDYFKENKFTAVVQDGDNDVIVYLDPISGNDDTTTGDDDTTTGDDDTTTGGDDDTTTGGNNNTTTTPVVGDLIVHAMTKTEDTAYTDFNYGKAITLEGKADAALNKSLAESVIGKQLIDYKWQGASKDANGNVTVNLLATIMETKDNKDVYKLRVMFNRGNGNDDYKQIDIYEGEGILAAIKNAGITPKYEDHVLVGYLRSHTGTSKSYLTIYDVADGDDADSSGVIKVWADWREKTDDDDEDYEYGEGGGLYGDDNDDPIYDVVLYIYTNGKTSSYAKKVTSSTMGKHTKDGVLSRDEVELVVQNYFKTTSDTKYYGLFNKYYWNSGNYLTENAKYSIELDPDETNYVYVMVKNATAYVADSSNPKTGDTIMIAVTTMALAAAGVVSMIELKKRKMI